MVDWSATFPRGFALSGSACANLPLHFWFPVGPPGHTPQLLGMYFVSDSAPFALPLTGALCLGFANPLNPALVVTLHCSHFVLRR